MDDKFKRLDCLLDRLLNEGVVPFLGAGISMSAQHPGNFEPSLSAMQEALRKYLEKNQPNECLIERRDYFETYLNHLQSASFDQLADYFVWEHGQIKLCEVLRIHEYCQLIPTPAHQYLAFLAREGLIHEILTTNYDTCIEKAFRNTFHTDNDAQNRLYTITSLEQYRASAGKRWDDEMSHHPVLRVIKLNGCAHEYNDKREHDSECHKRAAQTILLTEQQLQTHDHDPWKKDLLRDRLRCYNLLFCGFGNNEPQVRYLTMQIHKEFGNNGQNGSDLLKLPNTPFITVHKYALEFPQLQILASFYQNHGLNFIHELHKSRYDTPVFCAEDVTILCPNNSNKPTSKNVSLSADLFFEWLFQGAYKILLQRFTRHGSPFYTWLYELTPHPDAWINFLFDHLYPENEDLKFRLGDWNFYLTLDKNKSPLLPLMQLLSAIIDPIATTNRNWYLPLREEPVSIPCFLLLLSLLDIHQKSNLEPVLDENGGVFVLLTSDCQAHTHPDLHMQIISHALLGQACHDQSDKHRLRFRISIPDLGINNATEERWQHEASTRPGCLVKTLTIGRVRNIPLEWLIRKMGSPLPNDTLSCRLSSLILEAMGSQYDKHAAYWRIQPLEPPK